MSSPVTKRFHAAGICDCCDEVERRRQREWDQWAAEYDDARAEIERLHSEIERLHSLLAEATEATDEEIDRSFDAYR